MLCVYHCCLLINYYNDAKFRMCLILTKCDYLKKSSFVMGSPGPGSGGGDGVGDSTAPRDESESDFCSCHSLLSWCFDPLPTKHYFIKIKFYNTIILLICNKSLTQKLPSLCLKHSQNYFCYHAQCLAVEQNFFDIYPFHHFHYD